MLEHRMYDLHLLGWHSFQQLCHTITREILGQTVESFLDTHDGGRDGAFTGNWATQKQEDLTGPFVIQCKFKSKTNVNLRASDLSDEVEKARNLVNQGLCESYVLMTNAGITGTGNASIRMLFEEAGAKHVAIFDSTWICQQIHENKRLRMLVPRIYGLGDLSQILDGRAYTQAKYILESMREDLAKVIVTKAYRDAARAIDEHGFVLLLGEPASGKTTIASLLAMAAVDQWKASILKLDDPQQVAERWNPHEPSQFFWLDDAFGVTQYDYAKVGSWNHVLQRLPAMLNTGARIVMTSRDYIYQRARNELKNGIFPQLDERQVVIDVRDLTVEEKERIIYNHMRLGKQPRAFKTNIKPHLESVARNSRFIPETARRLSHPLFTKGLAIHERGVREFAERREQLLVDIIQGLDPDSKGALAIIYMRNDRLESPAEFQASEKEVLERLGSTVGGCITALQALNGSLVLLSRAGGDSVWKFIHPTVGDAYAAILLRSPEHIGIFIRGSAPERLVNQVTCGDVGLENAIVVPWSLFPQIVTKLQDLSGSQASYSLQGFLARRCSKEFLSLYLEHDPEVIDDIANPQLFPGVFSRVDLAARLHEFGLLPDEQRRAIVDKVTEYALDGEDASAFSNPHTSSLFTGEELEDLTQRVREEVVPRLGDFRDDLEFAYSPEDRADEHVQGLQEYLYSIKRHFKDDEDVVQAIDDEIWRTETWIGDNTLDEVDEADPDQLPLFEMGGNERPQDARSVFDDIDGEDDSNDDFP